jgi:hypothetical protein
VKTRLSRPVLAAVVGGALLAGSALTGTPAYANPGTSSSDTPTGKLEGGQTATTLDTADPETPDPETPDPETPDPGTPTPETPDPGTGDPGTGEPAPDTTKPTGSFRLNYTSVWAGQVITVGQNATEFSDPVDAPDTLKRVISWGDGTSTELGATTFTATKAYTRAGNFQVTVTVTDPAGNKSEIPARPVAVSLPAGKITTPKYAYQGAPFTVKVTKVPAGASTLRIDWTDGTTSTHKARVGSISGAYIHYYWKWDAAKKRWVRNGSARIAGNRVLKVSWGSYKGYSVYQPGATINILRDGWKPSLKITKPSSTSKASSWKTIRGTVADKGSGLRHVGVTVFRVTSTGKTYCLTAQKKWKRYTSDATANKYCYATGYKVKVVKGKWSLKLPTGIAKNQFIAVEAWAYDHADNFRSTYRTARLTRS